MADVKRVVLTGASGFIGSRLARSLLCEGHSITVLARDTERSRRALGPDVAPSVATIRWDFTSTMQTLPPCDALIHLAGEPIFGKRWTPVRKELLRSSRVSSTQFLIESMRRANQKPQVFVCASAIGFYGDRCDALLDESSKGGSDFLATICADWEKTAAEAVTLGVRVASVRIGVVLGTGGGALQRMLPPFRLGVGGRIGSGNQWMSWVHLDDAVGIIRHALTAETVRGPINATSPNPVTNREFAKTLGRVLRRPTFLPLPSLALGLALGEVASVVTCGQRVLPRVALSTGYNFRYPHLESSLRALTGGESCHNTNIS